MPGIEEMLMAALQPKPEVDLKAMSEEELIAYLEQLAESPEENKDEIDRTKRVLGQRKYGI